MVPPLDRPSLMHNFGGALRMLFAWATPMQRERRSRWGVDGAAAARTYPGDGLVARPRWGWTHGVEIDAPPAAVWPWIVQIGQGRAGFYSYELLENLAGCEIDNADRVHPEWQTLAVGDVFRLHPSLPMTIHAIEPGRWFVAEVHVGPAASATEQGFASSWLFLVEPVDDGRRTRFISRFRTSHGDSLGARLAHGPLLLEPIGFVMDRGMLLGVKARAERAHAGEHAPA